MQCILEEEKLNHLFLSVEVKPCNILFPVILTHVEYKNQKEFEGNEISWLSQLLKKEACINNYDAYHDMMLVGLPAPECSDNPLGYKFSWSPRGALLNMLSGG